MLRKVLVCVALLSFLMVGASGCGSDESKNPKVEKPGGALQKLQSEGKKSESKIAE
jgi:hypothetical protein